MNRVYFSMGITFLFLSLIFVAVGIWKGYLKFIWAIVPVVVGTGIFSAIIFITLVLGMIFLFFSLSEGEKESNFEYGGAIVIGPFPIIFGSSRWMIIVSLILLIIFIFLLILFL